LDVIATLRAHEALGQPPPVPLIMPIARRWAAEAAAQCEGDALLESIAAGRSGPHRITERGPT
jgi:hypothetical protein